MKKKILSLLVLLIIPVFVNADSININCPSEVAMNTEFSCDITGTSTGGVTDVSFKIKLSDKLSFVTFVKGSNWNGEGDLQSVELYGSDVIKDTFKIGTLKLKSSTSNGNISLYDVLFYNDIKTTNVDTINKEIKIISNNKSSASSNNAHSNAGSSSKKNVEPASSSSSSASSKVEIEKTDGIDYDKGAFLKDLKINGYTINFRSDVFNYDLQIKDETELKITPVVSNKDITYEVFNNKDLKDGSQIYIEVKYKSDELQTYYINISKENSSSKSKLIPIFIGIIIVLVIINIVRLLKGNKENASK